MRTAPDLEPGEEFRMNKFLVEIVKRRLEGKSSIRRENNKNNGSSGKQSSSSKSKGAFSSLTGSKQSPNEFFNKGEKTGMLSASKNPLLSSAIG
jgi:hypothetical protein